MFLFVDAASVILQGRPFKNSPMQGYQGYTLLSLIGNYKGTSCVLLSRLFVCNILGIFGILGGCFQLCQNWSLSGLWGWRLQFYTFCFVSKDPPLSLTEAPPESASEAPKEVQGISRRSRGAQGGPGDLKEGAEPETQQISKKHKQRQSFGENRGGNPQKISVIAFCLFFIGFWGFWLWALLEVPWTSFGASEAPSHRASDGGKRGPGKAILFFSGLQEAWWSNSTSFVV